MNQDVANFINFKLDMFAYGQRLPLPEPMNKGWDLLGSDQIYVINLDKRPDRLSNIKAIFNALQIQFTRMPAVDGTLHVTSQYLKYQGIRMMEGFSDHISKNRPLTLGEIGCFMSHYNIWNIVVEKNLKDVIIFEDDIRLEPFFKQRFKTIRKVLDHMDWDLVYLGRILVQNYQEEDWVKGSNQSLVHVDFTYGTPGYMLSHSGSDMSGTQKFG